MKKKATVVIIAAVLGCAFAMVISLALSFVLFHVHKEPELQTEMIQSLKELDCLSQLGALFLDPGMDPNSPGDFVDRRACTVERDGKTYQIFAYEFSDLEAAQEYYHAVTGRYASAKPKYYLAQLDTGSVFCCYQNRCAYAVRGSSRIGILELVNALGVLLRNAKENTG